ncbi:MAG: flagellar biosynthetic protein [Sphingorhabdus sp.]
MSEPGFIPLMREPCDDTTRFQAWGDPAPFVATSAPSVDEYARGLHDGQQLAETAFGEERQRLQRLVAAAQALQPVDADAVRTLILSTVGRLVGEIVATAPVDKVELEDKIDALIEQAGILDQKAILWLAPDDFALMEGASLAVSIAADAALMPGTLRLETPDGEFEHGRAIQLEKLHDALGMRR